MRRTLYDWLLLACLSLASFLRVWNLPNTIQFLSDQGRDAIVVMRFIRFFDPMLIGPVTSNGNMYLGPAYYYLMAPFLALTFPSPIGPAYGVAIFGVLTVFLIYYLGREMVGKSAAVLAAFMASISGVLVEYSRFSWNPNLAPLVMMLLIWSLFRFWTRSRWYFVLSILWFSLLIQLHYVTLLTAPVIGFVWLACLIEQTRLKKEKVHRAWSTLKLFLPSTLSGISVFILSLLPQIIFEFLHNFINTSSFLSFIGREDGSFTRVGTSIKFMRVLGELHGRSMQILFEMFIGTSRQLNTWLVVLVILGSIFLWRSLKNQSDKKAFSITVLSLVTAAVGLAFYRGSVFHHYVLFTIPVTFLLFGQIIIFLWKKFLVKILLLAFLSYFILWNISTVPLKSQGWKLRDIERVANSVLARVKPGEKYNIVLLSEIKDFEGTNYRYFLEASEKPPVSIEKRGETETLFIINEDGKLKDTPNDSPIYEIVVFPNHNPSEVYSDSGGPRITVLRK